MRESPSIEKYYMIDPRETFPNWTKPFNVDEEEFEAVLREMYGKTNFAAHKRHILRGRTNEVVGAIPHGFLDFAYIDGDHTLRGIIIGLISIWPKIRNGGYIGGDDFTNKPWGHGKSYEPTLVFPLAVYFGEAVRAPIVALDHGQFLITKDINKGFSFTDSVGVHGDLSVRGLGL